jgi:hypothetical protein
MVDDLVVLSTPRAVVIAQETGQDALLTNKSRERRVAPVTESQGVT